MQVFRTRLSPLLRAAAALLLLAASASCVTLQEDYQTTPSYAFSRPEETTLGRAYQADQARQPGQTGFRLINGGVSALMTRAVLADLAERSIDVQYYIYEADAAGAFLLERLIAAAERGVRVRILLDDYNLGFEDVALVKLVDAHPQIEIRIFNPFPHRARWSRPLQLALRLDQLGMRMHNKVFVADLIWARAEAVAELPVREAKGPAAPEKSQSAILRSLASARKGASSELVMVMAYYIPGKRGLEVVSELVARGVKVRVLTNSLASTDVLAVHAGYSRYRPALLAAGIELHEYRTDAPRPAPKGHVMRDGQSDSALHAKVRVYDGRIVWIGSDNSDPRSRRINTEVGLLIQSEALAARLLKALEQDFSPQHSWRLTLAADGGPDGPQIVWNGEQDGKPVRLREEPGGGLRRALSMFLYSIMPDVEDLL
jgi:phosphatidylserine/phosphatidylglycerophosphate/cardiolipin synthase-like enzyme